MYVICNVTNSIGKIKVKKLDEFVKNAYEHWITSFGKFRTLKSSLHWTLGHVTQLIAMNNGYSLAEISENSLEALIKHYRYVTKHMARQSSFVENTQDCLKTLYILSLYKMRQHEKITSKALKNDEMSEKIRDFFENGNSASVNDIKWKVPELD